MIIDVEAILFDSDGVLVDSHEQVVVAWSRLALEFGLEIEPLLVELVGRRAADTLSRHLSPADTEAAVARLEDLEVEQAASTEPIPGAIELIAALDGAPWAIVTSASKRLAIARWAGAGIPLPPATVTAEDVLSGKPNPEPFLVGAGALSVSPGRCVVFEDSSSGGSAAVAAGATAVAVGAQAWSEEPSARVVDLRSVTAGFNRDSGLIRLVVEA